MPHGDDGFGEEMDIGAGIVAVQAGGGEREALDHGVEVVGFGTGPDAPGEFHRVDIGHFASRKALNGGVVAEKRDVEAVPVVGGESGIGDEARERLEAVRGLWRGTDIAVGDASERSDVGWNRGARTHECGEALSRANLAVTQADGGDLDDLVVAGREAGGFEVEDDEVHGEG